MADIPEIIDAEFAQVSPSDREWLVEKIRAQGIGQRELRQIMSEAGHPEFLPGGKYHRPPSIWRRLPWLKFAPAAILVTWFAVDLVFNEAATYQVMRFFCTHGLQCPASAPALLPR